jgi:hypothetical protein
MDHAAHLSQAAGLHSVAWLLDSVTFSSSIHVEDPRCQVQKIYSHTLLVLQDLQLTPGLLCPL